MKTIQDELSQILQAAFARAYPDMAADNATLSSFCAWPTADAAFGDYQCNAAMALAKSLKQPPRQIAQAIVGHLPENPWIEKTEIAGPGFINLTLSAQALARHLETMRADAFSGIPQCGSGQTLIIDYSSPNVAKPMHIAHIRSTVIGDALKRIHRALGYTAIGDNHLGDWGTQFGILIMGYRHFLNPDALKESPVDELQRLYVLSHQKCEEDENWKNQARAELVKLQSGDPENRALWQTFIDLSLEEFNRLYARLDVAFDLTRGESYYNEALPGVVEKLQSLGLIRESEGALVAFFDDAEKLPPCIIRKSDGGFNYATTDLATVFSREAEFHPEEIIYVTDERQQLHFRQFFTLAQKAGANVKLRHIWFGLMRLPEGLLSTRKGTAIKLEMLLDEAEKRALELVQQSSPHMAPEQHADIAKAVGIGAVKYADLSQNPQSAITFSWEKALAMDGNSAPYLQYAYARIASVRDKYRERFPDGDFMQTPISIEDPMERKLGVKLAQYPEAVLAAATQSKPSLLADYLYDLAQIYSSFYQNVPFLKAQEGTRESRVRLCDLTAHILTSGLSLLGIRTPERI